MSGVVLKTAAVTAGSLFTGMLAGVLSGFALQGLPIHIPERTMFALGGGSVLAGTIGGGALWGSLLARITHQAKRRRMTTAGGLSFGPLVTAAVFLLTALEGAIVERGEGPDLPVYVVFTLLFVPATLVVAGAGGAAMGVALQDRALAMRLGIGCGLAGAGGFLVVDVVMDALGYRVGAPGASARATMLTVMFLGSLAAALAGGAVLGYLLPRNAKPALVGGEPAARPLTRSDIG